MRKKLLIDLVKAENNPVVIEKAIIAMQTDPRLKFYEEKFDYAATNGKGRLRKFFKAISSAKIFDKSVVLRLAGKSKHSHQIDSMLGMVDEQIDGAYIDLGKRHGNFLKLTLLIDQAIKDKRLPLRDEDGDIVPIYPRYTLYDDVVDRLKSAMLDRDNVDQEEQQEIDEQPTVSDEDEPAKKETKKNRFAVDIDDF